MAPTYGNGNKNGHYQPDCAHCGARSGSILAELPVDELPILSSGKACTSYHKGESVFSSGEMPRGIFCMRQGKVKVYKLGRDGREQIIRICHTGEILGYRALIGGDSYQSSAVLLEDSHICLIPKELFFSLLALDQDLSMRLMTLLANDLGMANERIIEMAQKSVRERMAEALLLLKETYGTTGDGMTLNIEITRADLGNIIGTATETAIRTLSDFRQHKMISFRGKKIQIINHAALLHTANVCD